MGCYFFTRHRTLSQWDAITISPTTDLNNLYRNVPSAAHFDSGTPKKNIIVIEMDIIFPFK